MNLQDDRESPNLIKDALSSLLCKQDLARGNKYANGSTGNR
jgi:hypothetical protein